MDFLEAVAAFCCVLGVHGLVSSVIEPIIYGRRYEVHPVAVVVALTIWVSLWGFIGALISTPFLIFLRITLEDQVHPVAQGLFSIIRGRPVGDSIATAQSTGVSLAATGAHNSSVVVSTRCSCPARADAFFLFILR